MLSHNIFLRKQDLSKIKLTSSQMQELGSKIHNGEKSVNQLNEDCKIPIRRLNKYREKVANGEAFHDITGAPYKLDSDSMLELSKDLSRKRQADDSCTE
jgi:hypothetical protein